MPSSAQRRHALERFARDFGRGAHWEAHEHLEEWWRLDRQDLWQALIQIAATFVLLKSDRIGGARSVHARARAKLAPLPATLEGVDVAWLRGRCDALAQLLDEAPTLTEAQALFDELEPRLGLVP